jgi:acetyl-CoA C-acetyltransferase
LPIFSCGRSELVLAGGVDALSRAPLLYNDTMVRWFAGMMSMRTVNQKIGHFLKLRPPRC